MTNQNNMGFDKTIDWYNQNAKKYADASIDAFSPQDREQLEEFSKLLKNNSKILDAGCGSGRDTVYLSKKGFNVIGIDMSSGLINEAKIRFPNYQFKIGDLRKLLFENSELDAIWAHASLLHFETIDDISQSLNEFNRVLKSEGVLHILVKAQKGKNKTAIVSDSISKHDRFFQYFTEREISNFVTKSGFNILRIEQYSEIDKNPKGRPGVDWILVLARKNEI